MFENTSVDYNTGKTDKFSTSLCIRCYYHGWLLTVSHHIVQVVMVAQHCFCCWVTGIHVLNVTTTIMMANNVNKHSSKELHRSGLRNQHLFLSCLSTGHVSLHDRPSHFMKRKAINLCVLHAYQSEKSCLQPKYSSQRQTFAGSGISQE